MHAQEGQLYCVLWAYGCNIVPGTSTVTEEIPVTFMYSVVFVPGYTVHSTGTAQLWARWHGGTVPRDDVSPIFSVPIQFFLESEGVLELFRLILY